MKRNMGEEEKTDSDYFRVCAFAGLICRLLGHELPFCAPVGEEVFFRRRYGSHLQAGVTVFW